MGRERLAIPLAAGVALLWLAAGVASLVTREIQVLVIATGPFTIVLGYVFGISVARRAESHISGPREDD